MKQAFAWIAFVWLAITSAAALQAKEPVLDFLEGLRQRQYFDIADQYLESLRTNSNISADIRQIIPYEQGRTLVDASREIRDMPLRLKALDRATEKFQEFLQASPDHALAAGANTQLGNVLFERGRALVEQANKPSKVAEKDQLLKQGRDFYTQAQKVFEDAEKKFVDAVNAYPKFIDPKDSKQIEGREQALSNLISARMLLATVLAEHGKSYPDDDPQYKKLVQASADKFKELFEKYRRRLAGLYAGMWYGQRLYELKDSKRALGIYTELLVQPDEPPEFRVMKSKALRLAMEAWTDDSQKLYDEAIKRGEEWLRTSRGLEDRTPEGQGIRYYTALALSKKHDSLDKQAKAADAAKKMVRDLSNHAMTVAKISGGEYSQLAKDLLSKYRDLGGKGPQNFAEAKDAGKMALDNMQAAVSKIKLAAVTKEQDKIPEYEKEQNEYRAEAIKMFKLALRLKDSETTLDDINVIRYFLTYLNYDAGNIYDAAVLGEFLARKYPKSAGARQGAKIALAAYLTSYNAADPKNRQFEVGKMVGIADYITRAWPTEAESDEAWMLLGDVAIRENNLDQAAKYLSKIPENSPRRGEADLKAGQALWGTYLTTSRLEEDERKNVDLAKLSQQAQETLERGVKRMREAATDVSQVNYTLLASELSLAQIYIGSGQAEKAVALLETPDSGILAMVHAKNPVVEKGNFPEEAYKAALRAYVGAQQMEKAEKAMASLDDYVAKKPGGDQATLTRIYISLGRELEEQVQALKNDPTKKEALDKVLQGFETFLTKLSDRKEGNSFNSLSWVGETFFRLGSGLDTGGAVTEQAKDYYAKAFTAYDNLITLSKKDAKFAPSADAITALEIRLSMCERRQGKYKEALDRLEAILKTNDKLLEAQRQAAYTYQEWATQNPGYFLNAMLGGRPNPKTKKNTIWGWHMLSIMVQTNPNKDIGEGVFHEARYNLALSRYKHALVLSPAEKLEKLKSAQTDITITYRLRPTMGEKYQWKDKYDKLLQDVQKALGEKATGLSGLETVQPAAPATASAKAG